MATFPNSPRLLKGGLVVLDPDTGSVQRIVTLQYNPDTLTRTLQVQSRQRGGDRSEALRLKGPPIETIGRRGDRRHRSTGSSRSDKRRARHPPHPGGARNHRLPDQ